MSKKARYSLILVLAVTALALFVSQTASGGTWYLGWADNYIVGFVSAEHRFAGGKEIIALRPFGTFSRHTRCREYMNCTETCPGPWGCPAGQQFISTKGNALTRAGYYLADHDSVFCATLTATLDRYVASNGPCHDHENACSSIGTLEKSESRYTNTCYWPVGDFYSATDWSSSGTQLTISHSYSNPTAGWNSYYVKLTASVDSNSKWDDGCYAIRWM